MTCSCVLMCSSCSMCSCCSAYFAITSLKRVSKDWKSELLIARKGIRKENDWMRIFDSSKHSFRMIFFMLSSWWKYPHSQRISEKSLKKKFTWKAHSLLPTGCCVTESDFLETFSDTVAKSGRVTLVTLSLKFKVKFQKIDKYEKFQEMPVWFSMDDNFRLIQNEFQRTTIALASLQAPIRLFCAIVYRKWPRFEKFRFCVMQDLATIYKIVRKLYSSPS